ncbi:MAG TPA: phenol hydroxylase [Thermopetrobacter sp.]|nr:phenol hydroxylase [Thermopetrobacter sp.]
MAQASDGSGDAPQARWTFNPAARYVRITRVRDNGLVEFDFAIGEPTLYVELMLPRAAFDEFCERNAVTFLSDEECEIVDLDSYKWRYGRPGRPGSTDKII